MEMYMIGKIHNRFRETHHRNTGLPRVMNVTIDMVNILIKVGLGVLLMWMIANA